MLEREKPRGLRQWSGVILIILILVLIGFTIFQRISLNQWLQNEGLNVLFAVILAIISGLSIEFIYRKFSTRSHFSRTTMIIKPRNIMARMNLPDGKHLSISELNRVFGREDFLGAVVGEKLLFIGKEHFKITRMDDKFYIKDLNTKNGTWVNGKNIQGLGKIKLTHNDEIDVAHALTTIYQEKDLIED